MKSKVNRELSRFVGSAFRNAIRQNENYMWGYLRGQKRIMRRDGTLSIADYVHGWKMAKW